MKKHRLNLAIKLTPPLRQGAGLIVVTLIVFFVLYFTIGYIWRFLRTSDYFQVKDIITRESHTVDLSYLKERNIFNVDLKDESRFILESCPNCSNVKLVRVLPNRIFVDFIKRKPLGLVKLYRYFALDENGVLFYATGEPQDLDLPIILGLETKIFGPKPGRKYNNRELLLALEIIREVARNKNLRNYKLKRIDVSNLTNASMFIILPSIPKKPEGLEIKLGADNIKDKIVILAGLITAARNDLSNIKYIDLKFKDPVIRFNDAKSK